MKWNFYFLFAVYIIFLSSWVSALGTFPSVDPSMIVYYHLNDTNSTIKDYSGKGNDAIGINLTFNSTGGYFGNGGIEFNGSIASINVTNPVISNFSNYNWTFMFWIKAPLVTTNTFSSSMAVTGSLNATSPSLFFSLRNSNYQFRYINATNDHTAQSAQINDTWTFITSRVTGNILTLYVNGNLTATTTLDELPGNLNNPQLIIGKITGLTNFNGSISEFILFNKSVSPNYISEVYNQYTTGNFCVNPSDDLSISDDRVYLCAGNFLINDTANNGIIRMFQNNVALICNNTNITSLYNQEGNDVRGIQLSASNVTIIGCSLNNLRRAIYSPGQSSINLTNNSFSQDRYAIYLDNIQNSSINMNNFIDGSAELQMVGQSYNISITNNIWRHCSTYNCIANYNSSFISYINNSFLLQSKSIAIGHSSHDILFDKNFINNSITSYDGWSTGILGYAEAGGSRNVIISNNVVLNSGCQGLLLEAARNWTIINNTFTMLPIGQRISNQVDCRYEVPAGISALEVYRTYNSDQPRDDNFNDTNLTFNNNYNSSNLFIQNNSISGFDVILRLQGSINVTHDINSSWYIKHQLPTFFISPEELYINSSYNNVSNTKFSGGIGDINYQFRQGFKFNYYVNYSINKDYIYYGNMNNSLLNNISIFNNSLSLIYYSNYTPICTNINNCNGQINLSLSPITSAFWLNNYNLTEGANRVNSPVWFHASYSVSKDIKSNLTDSVITSIIISTPSNCSAISRIIYDGAAASPLQYSGQEARDICTNLTTVGQQFMVDPTGGGSDNLLTFFSEPGSATYACDLLDIRCILVNELIGSPTMAMILAVLAFCLLAAKMRLGFETTITLAVPIVLGFAVVIYGFSIIYGFATFIAGLMVALAFLRLWGNK